MHRALSLVIVALSLLFGRSAEAKLAVVTSTATLASLVREVGGDRVKVTSLALPTQDPHFVDAKPRLALELKKADLLVVVGLDLEIGWLPVLQTGSRNGKVQVGAEGYLDCSRFVRVLDVPEGKVDRAAGDVHPQGNPHYLYDPRQAARVTKAIADKLAELDPSHTDDYRKNALEFVKKLGKSTKLWEAQLAHARGAKVVAYHKSFSYLTDWLGLDVIAHIEPRPGVPPTPHHVAQVIELAKRRQVKLVLEESYYFSATGELVARKIGATLARVPAAPSATQGYIAHLDAIVKKLARVYEK
ncbi:MAG: zinc ABC transporter substrate-binding protein [Sorangiineae bacterium]|nr:zinc ABC transporter substrate-binding protein [Polyangiaceae bacterium]MEB2324732.1 zinc ABC transporter substrate-binding protein [Sorangiineae bacterium]